MQRRHRPDPVLSSLIAALVATVMLSPALAPADERPALAIGDRAPVLDADRWLHGDAVEAFEEGQIYVVELWATWCGPCKQSMPHLEALQAELGDQGVHVLGISNEDPDVVELFLTERRAPLGYAIAADPDGSVEQGWLEAARASGIPTAFIVGRTGHIEWIGHPMRMETVLTAVVEDRFDRDAYATWHTEHETREAELRTLVEQEKWSEALDSLAVLVADHRLDTDLYGEPTAHELQHFRLAMAHADDAAGTWRLGDDLVGRHWEDAGFLNDLAWAIATDPDLPERELDLALKASVRSNLLTHSANAAHLDTLARIYYERAELETALRYQRQAIDAMQTEHPELRQALERYEREAAEAGLVVTKSERDAGAPAATPVDPSGRSL